MTDASAGITIQITMSEQNELAVTGLDKNYTASVTESALQKRQELLETASLITHVGNVQEQNEATEVAANLKAWNKNIEKARTFFTAPLLAAQRLLKSTADKAIENTEKEAKRLESLLADFHREQEAIARKAREEQARKEAEALAEIARKEKAESDRLAEIERRRIEQEQLAISARNKKDREAAAAEAARLREQQEQEEFDRGLEQPAAPVVAYVPPPEVVKPKGAAVRERIFFEVVDVEALHKARPDLVELIPKTQAINFYLATPGVDINQVPGIRAWKEDKVSVRASSIQQDALSA